jgi:hypothetical protein
VKRHLLVGAALVAAMLLVFRAVAAEVQDILTEPETVEPAPCTGDDDFEQNDSASAATNLIIGTSITAIACDGDPDYYRVAIPEAGPVLTVDVRFAHTDGDLYLELQDSSGRLIAEADGSGDQEHLEHTITAPGDYYVVVASNLGSATYDLEATTSTCIDDTYEPNDGVSSARSLASGQQLAGRVCPGNDDYYAIEAMAGRPVVVWASFDQTEGDLDLELRDERDNIVGQSLGYGDLEEIEFTPTESGTFYAVVYGANVMANYELAATVTAPPEGGSLFTAVDPTRILDSRAASQVGPYSSKWGSRQTRDVKVEGIGGVPADVEAVALNVTVTGASTSSNLRMWPAGGSLPLGSTMTWQAGWTIAHAVTVKVGDAGAVSVYNHSGSVDVVIDVVGYYRTGGGAGFTALEPSRVLDSRPASRVGPYASPWESQQSRNVVVAGVAGVPADAESVVLNVTTTGTTASSNLRLWPAGLEVPLASSLNWQSGWSIANLVTVKVGDGGAIGVYNNNGSTDVVIDVVGYFRSGSGQLFHPSTPQRVQDSRPGSQVGPYGSKWSGPQTRDVTVTAVAGVPENAEAVMLNVAVTGTTASSNLRVWPAGPPAPMASNLNWQPGWAISNAATVKVGSGGAISVYNNNGFADVVIDVYGWYG